MKQIIAAFLILACASQAGSVFIRAGGFPAGTRISAISGSIKIEDLRQGDRILAYSKDTLIQVNVQNIYKKQSILYILQTSNGRLTTTRYNLLLTWKGFTDAEKLKPEDEVAVLKNGRRAWARIKSARTGEVGTVYNIETGPPHTFVANDFLAHN